MGVRRMLMVAGLVLAARGLAAAELVEAPDVLSGLAAIGVPEDRRELLQGSVGELADGPTRAFAVRLAAAVDSRDRDRVVALMSERARAMVEDEEVAARIADGTLLAPAGVRVLAVIRKREDGSRRLVFSWYDAEKGMLRGTALPIVTAADGGLLLDR